MVKLDILSDPLCPWCYIGKANLDRALESRPLHPFVIEWHPFQLNPDMPAGGLDRREYLEAKFGGRDKAVEAYANVQRHAEAAGLSIDFGRIERTPNTLDAHRLIHWAGLEGRQTAAVTALFRGYFVEGRDIGVRQVLTEIAAGIGLDAGLIERLLAGDGDREEIAARDAHSRQAGVTGVPTFIVAQRHVVVGAQPPDLWQSVIDELAGEDAPNGTPDAAGSA
ncbi:DsbA family oxidoreductase [Wenxinia marina]|uniref:Putative dithiol-disulfide isomerase involved in polyketide biosynthesis n=1 Tax=Wenxinia marina DSM 24838 TaxID=1123501 RepID=A0A0D0Q5Z5_9RHOB|nr:DsbA family oxidoreductase [Wenxinia marina]KIQ67912.1 putative dithiol-disulfide isomerase involved in polyketide biosynthesis [Wenxinia marina DSM 24838]GGL74164.1 polyketide biosynthesis protein [Wenxinia marina]